MERAECSIALELSLLQTRNRKRGKNQEVCSELERQLNKEVKIARKSSKKATPQPCSTASSGKEYRYGSKGIEKAPTTRSRPQNVATISRATTVTTTIFSEMGSADLLQSEDTPHTLVAGNVDNSVEEELNDLIEQIAPETAKRQQTWQERQENQQESWERFRPRIFEELLMYSSLPPDTVCSCCGGCDVALRCNECGPSKYLCEACDQEVHRYQPLHDREVWDEGSFHPIAPISTYSDGQIVTQNRCIPFTFPVSCPICGEKGKLGLLPRSGMRIFVNLKGRFDLNDATPLCHACGEVMELTSPHDVIREGYWPGSAERRSRYIYDQDLFLFYDLLQKNNPGISEYGFLKTLEQFSEVKGRRGSLNASTFSKAFDEWRYCQYSLRIEECTPLFECPCCLPLPHSIHFDGNKKLYRYSKVPRGSRKPYYEGDFIVANEKVDKHLDDIGYTTDIQAGNFLCGTTRWKAAKAISKTMSNLDECGLEVAGCRHAFGLKAVNMFRGEIYGYPHYLHVEIFPNVEYIWEDVICLYWPWAQKKSQRCPSYLEAMKSKPCLSVMHAKAHSWHCQILWGGRWQDGAAYGAGEDMEQLFSYLSRFNNTTKNMSAAGREEQLTEAVLFWNERKLQKLPRQLWQRLQKTRKEFDKLQLELLQLQDSVGQDLNPEYCEAACKDIQQIAREEANNSDSVQLSVKMAEYYKLKHSLESASQLQSFLHTTNEALSLVTETEKLYQEAIHVSGQLVEKREQLTKLEASLAESGVTLANLDSQCKEAAIQLAHQKLQEKIELQYLLMQRRHISIQNLSTSSKQRARLRQAISEDRSKLKNLVQQYNSMSNTLIIESTVSEEEACSGEFPWSELSGRRSISTQQKLQIADTFSRMKRLKEEERLLQTEMKQFILHFKETIPRQLQADIDGTVIELRYSYNI